MVYRERKPLSAGGWRRAPAHPRPAATPRPPTQKKKKQHSVLSFTNQEGGNFNVARGGKLGVHLTPLPARQVGDGQKRPPVVGGAVVELAGHLGVGAAQRGEMIRGPPRRPPPELLEAAWPVEPQALDVLSRSAATHRHDQAAIGKGVRQPADERHRLGRPGREAARLVVVADRAHHVGRVAGVAAVEDAAQLFLVAQVGAPAPPRRVRTRLAAQLAERAWPPGASTTLAGLPFLNSPTTAQLEV